MLTQKSKENNWNAMRAFLQDCVIVVDNGSTVIFKAQGVYKAKNKSITINIPSCEMSYGTNSYGGMSLSIPSLDETKYFTEISTDFSLFNYEDRIMKIAGEDKTGTGKGDYEIILIP